MNVLKLTCDLAVLVQVDPGNTGRVGPTEAALFLKKSGLPDMTLGKVMNEWMSEWVCYTFLACSLSFPRNIYASKLPRSYVSYQFLSELDLFTVVQKIVKLVG